MNCRSTRLLLLLGALMAIGCASRRAPNRANFRRGMQAYLERHGDLCIGRPSWPVDVIESDRSVGVQDALQLPVLERLGLVSSTTMPARIEGRETPFTLRRYRLTAAGRAHYMDRTTRAPLSPDDPGAATRADFCVLGLRLADIAGWEVQPHVSPPTALVSYTYTVQAPAWTRDAGFQKVFPAVARVLHGAGSARLVEGFTLTPDGWTANQLLPKPSASLQAAAR